MKTPPHLLLFLAGMSALVATASAQKAVFAENFNGYRDGQFISPAAGAAEPYAILIFDAVSSAGTIVPGDRSKKTTRHLELAADLKSPGFNIAGYGWKPDKQPRVRDKEGEDEEKKRVSRREEAAKDLNQYTLNFEIALVEGPGFKQGGLALDVILLGDTTGSGIRLNPDLTNLKDGAGFLKVSIPLKDGQPHMETATFDPTDTRFRIEFNTVGAVASSTTQKIAIDNIELVRSRNRR